MHIVIYNAYSHTIEMKVHVFSVQKVQAHLADLRNVQFLFFFFL